MTRNNLDGARAVEAHRKPKRPTETTINLRIKKYDSADQAYQKGGTLVPHEGKKKKKKVPRGGKTKQEPSPESPDWGKGNDISKTGTARSLWGGKQCRKLGGGGKRKKNRPLDQKGRRERKESDRGNNERWKN